MRFVRDFFERAFLIRRGLDSESIVQERWNASFRSFARKRFSQESGSQYQAYHRDGSFILRLRKKNLFGWTISPYYRYTDFCIEAELAFGPRNGYSAVGLALKHANDNNFYYFLLSNRGFFRFDLVFNANPMTL